MFATPEQAKELLEALRPLCVSQGKADLRLGVDLLAGLKCKYYWKDSPNFDIEHISRETVTHALLEEDSLFVEWAIKELAK